MTQNDAKNSTTGGGMFALLSALLGRLLMSDLERMRLFVARQVGALLSVVVVAFLLAGVGLMWLFYATQWLVVVSVETIGSEAMGYALAMLICLMGGLVICLCRQSLVVRPIIRMLTRLWRG
ncbi:MAG: hypothetical protein IJ013_07035 [Bacteroidaceae bacterium]|nr:hypothetical protein [Bacteroidaceae bacterium]